jgi:Rrf2 family protein
MFGCGRAICKAKPACRGKNGADFLVVSRSWVWGWLDRAVGSDYDSPQMRLSRRSEYACLAMVELASRYGQGPVRLVDVSRRQDIPPKYLVQILAALKTAGHVQSTRGPEGGYQLARPPGEITIAEVVRLMDGAIAPVSSVSQFFYAHTPLEKCPKLLAIMRDIRDYAAARLEGATFGDLV